MVRGRGVVLEEDQKLSEYFDEDMTEDEDKNELV